MKDLLPLPPSEVDRHAALVASDTVCVGAGVPRRGIRRDVGGTVLAHRLRVAGYAVVDVPVLHSLDPYDLRAEVAEQRRTERPGPDDAHVDDADTFERQLRHLNCSLFAQARNVLLRVAGAFEDL